MLGPGVTMVLGGPSKETKHLELNMASAIYKREAVGAQRRKMVSNPARQGQGPGRLLGGRDA